MPQRGYRCPPPNPNRTARHCATADYLSASHPAYLPTWQPEQPYSSTCGNIGAHAQLSNGSFSFSFMVMWLFVGWLAGWLAELSWAERAHWNRKRCCRYAEWMAWWHISGQKDNIFILGRIFFSGRSLCRCVGVLFRWPRNPVKFCVRCRLQIMPTSIVNLQK